MLKVVVLLTLVALLAFSAAPSFASGNTLVDIAASNSDFSTLVAAVQAAGLVDTLSSDGPFTVFAPTNAAFAQLLASLNLTAEQLLANEALLTQVLLYHVLPGKVMAGDIPGLLDSSGKLFAETAGGSRAVITVDGSRVFINDAQVVTANLEASNGVIHVINKVILPPGNLVNTAVAANASGNFDILLAAVQAAGLLDTLAEGGSFTILAPTDAAFEAALAALGLTAEQLLADTDLLTSVLLYHVIPGEFYSGDITAAVNGAGSFEAPSVNGDTISISVQGGFIKVDGANVIATNIVASNGVIHAIDAVILPD
jgi:uncharacterized surface protein with fasciclin (FAS1) repeats